MQLLALFLDFVQMHGMEGKQIPIKHQKYKESLLSVSVLSLIIDKQEY